MTFIYTIKYKAFNEYNKLVQTNPLIVVVRALYGTVHIEYVLLRDGT